MFADPEERDDVSARHPAIVSDLAARARAENATAFSPDRGASDQAGACEAALSVWGDFWGPWLE